MGEELSAARRADRHVFERVMTEQGRVRLSAQDAGSLLKVLNEGRLALGARFGVEVEADHEDLPEEQREVMDYLAWLLDDLTTELTRLL
jgi:ferric-dicitrate binding protein FerR (iron transport regulator)